MLNKETTDDVFNRIHKNYSYMNKMMVEEMDIASKHNGLTGNYREEMWIKFFRSIIPKKYSLEQGVMIIDSFGNISKEVDIAVFDEQYTPYVFQYNTLKFIPIESVAIVIECKSTSFEDGDLLDWAKSIDELETKRTGIARMVNGYVTGLTNDTQIKTRTIKILASIKDDKNNQTIEDRTERLGDKFDFIIQEQNHVFQVSVKNEKKLLGWWASRLNGTDTVDKLKIEYMLKLSDEEKKNKDIIKKKQQDKKQALDDEYPELIFDDELHLMNSLKDLKIKDNPLLALNLQLNQLLMLINNPMMFSHFAYAKTFKEIIEKEKTK